MKELAMEMARYFKGDPKRVQHLLKVHAFAEIIGEGEKISGKEMYILETAAYVHDIGIKLAELKYGACDGKLQEQEGPAEARLMLHALGYEDSVVERVAYLVGHHHTYQEIDGTDYQILLEADFLVNMYEDEMTEEAIRAAYQRIFRTETGKKLCRDLYL